MVTSGHGHRYLSFYSVRTGHSPSCSDPLPPPLGLLISTVLVRLDPPPQRYWYCWAVHSCFVGPLGLPLALAPPIWQCQVLHFFFSWLRSLARRLIVIRFQIAPGVGNSASTGTGTGIGTGTCNGTGTDLSDSYSPRSVTRRVLKGSAQPRREGIKIQLVSQKSPPPKQSLKKISK